MQTFDGGRLDGDRTSEQLRILLEPDSQGVCIRLVGEMDLATVPEVDRLLDELAGNGHGRLLIDLDGVEFMDSTGLASILRAMRAADANGYRLTVRRGSAKVQRLFELTGTLDHMTFED
jgi:anti-sigma B factor antagonist